MLTNWRIDVISNKKEIPGELTPGYFFTVS
nr:MAG TPA: hypothetical protein [Caudoviricetes sp.]